MKKNIEYIFIIDSPYGFIEKKWRKKPQRATRSGIVFLTIDWFEFKLKNRDDTVLNNHGP